MATETTTTSAYAWRPDVTAVAPRDAIPAALVLQTSTVAGTVEGDQPSVRVQYVDDADAGFVTEGSAFDEADPDLSECVVYTAKVGQLIRLSREQFSQPNSDSLLSESVARAVTKKANLAYIAQAAPSGDAVSPPAGLLHVSGILDGGTVTDSLDALIDLQAAIAGNDGLASHIVISPTAWASLRKLKLGADYNASLIGAGVQDAALALLDLPVLVSNAVPADTGLMIDRTAVVSAVGPVNVAVSDQVYFNSDSIGIRCSFRFGQNLVHPDRVGKFTVTDPDSSSSS